MKLTFNKTHFDKILIFTIAILIAIGVSLNLQKQYSIDRSKIPAKLEANGKFQRWLTNIKNKNIPLEADNLRFVEDSNIFNTIWTSTMSIDDENNKRFYDENIAALAKFKESEFSPNEREVVNYSDSVRFGYNPNEVFFYGLREDKVLQTRIVKCELEANCYFHRAGFLDNHVFFISEVSLHNFDDENPISCKPEETCSYSFRVHLVDLNNNSIVTYRSEPFDSTLLYLKKEL
ncbi:hypothetical protein EBU91_00500 [bacterium]|nr:hypothetical protein [bacterium]